MHVQWLFSLLKIISFILELAFFLIMKRVKIIVHGRVQGVFFRANARNIALNLGLKGYAKNLLDGSVEVIAEGEEEKLKRLVEFCKKGPERAEVTQVEVNFSDAKGEFENFEVRG